MRVGIICEGITDFVVLRAVIEAVLADRQPTCSLLQPDHDRLERPAAERGSAGGWQAVRSFLKAGNAQLAVGLGTIDLVIVQIDASVRHDDEVVHVLEDGELEMLCDHVKGWIGVPVSDAIVIVLPREEIETWLVALHTRRKAVEEIEDPAGYLLDEGLIEIRNRRPYKQRSRYQELVEPLPRLLGDRKRLRAVPELDRFCGKLRAHSRRR